MRVADVGPVVEIERQSFRVAWTPGMFLKEITAGGESVPLVALAGPRLVGYAVLWLAGSRVHLANIAVEGGFRRRGVGTELLRRVFEEARERNCRRVTLETRVSNLGAIGLFRKMGFRTVTLSPGYYTDNGEDALVMACPLTAGRVAEDQVGETGSPKAGS